MMKTKEFNDWSIMELEERFVTNRKSFNIAKNAFNNANIKTDEKTYQEIIDLLNENLDCIIYDLFNNCADFSIDCNFATQLELIDEILGRYDKLLTDIDLTDITTLFSNFGYQSQLCCDSETNEFYETETYYFYKDNNNRRDYFFIIVDDLNQIIDIY